MLENLIQNLAPEALNEIVNAVEVEDKILMDIFPEKTNKGAATGRGTGYTAKYTVYNNLNRLATPKARNAKSTEVNLNDLVTKKQDLISTHEHFPLEADDVDILSQLFKVGSMEMQGQAEALADIMQQVVNRYIALLNWERSQILFNAGVIGNTTDAALKFSIDYELIAALQATVAADATYDWLTGTAPTPELDLTNRYQAMADIGFAPNKIKSGALGYQTYMRLLSDKNSASQVEINRLKEKQELFISGQLVKWEIIDGAYVAHDGTETTYAGSTKIALVCDKPGKRPGFTEHGRPAVIGMPKGTVGSYSWAEVKDRTSVEMHTFTTSLAILQQPKTVGVFTFT